MRSRPSAVVSAFFFVLSRFAAAQTQAEAVPAGVQGVPRTVVAPLTTLPPPGVAPLANAAAISFQARPAATTLQPIPASAIAPAAQANAATPAAAALANPQTSPPSSALGDAPATADVDAALAADAAAAANGDPHAARRAAGDRLILAAGRSWTAEEYLADARESAEVPGTLAQEVASNLRVRAGLYESASRGQFHGKSLSPLDAAASRLILTPTAARLRRGAERADAEGNRYLDERISLERPTGDMALLRQIRAYIPTLDPDRVTTGQGLCISINEHGFQSRGTALIHPSWKGLTWLDKNPDTASFIEVAAHEGIHMGDAGYTTGESAFKMMVGEHATPLTVALLEGYTEWRTREFTNRLNSEAAAGAQGLPQEFAAAVRMHSRSNGDDALSAWRAEEAKHPYDPFTQMADAIIRRPGGRAALDAFVSRGDIAPLYFLLGRANLEHLAAIAASAADLPSSTRPDEAVLAERMGLQRWLLRGLAAVAAGSPWSQEETVRRADLASRLLAAAQNHVDDSPHFAHEGALWDMAELDLEDRLSSGESPELLIKAVDEAARSRGLRRYIPDALTFDWKKPFHQFAALGAILAIPARIYSHEILSYLTAHHLAGAFSITAASAAVKIPVLVFLYLALTGLYFSFRSLRENTASWLPYLLRRSRRRRQKPPPLNRTRGT